MVRAKEDTTVIGYALCATDGAMVATIERVCVRGDRRRRGVGAGLLKALGRAFYAREIYDVGCAVPEGIRAPEQSETKAQFADWKGRIDYVDDPNFLSVSGLDKLLNKKVSIAKRMKADDKAFVVAYPSANISELANTSDLYEDAVKGTGRHLVVVNGELERTRSNYYPPFWNMGEMGPLREFAKSFEGVYVIYNFKGSNPAVLFRCYPEPWQVFRRRQDERLELVCTLDAFESVKSIALDVLPRYP